MWLKHGHNPYVTLGLASKMNIHISVKYVTLEQLYDDINFLYFALKQTLKSRGSDLVIKEQETNNGISHQDNTFNSKFCVEFWY